MTMGWYQDDDGLLWATGETPLTRRSEDEARMARIAGSETIAPEDLEWLRARTRGET
jgi:hypothetical protein